MKILITGAAGFIGAALTQRLLRDNAGTSILGIDSLNDYYDPALKHYRLSEISKAASLSSVKWKFIEGNIADKSLLNSVFSDFRPDIVVNLAAQAGVRYSVENPDAYMESNIIGFYNVLEACRYSESYGSERVKHLVYASSSSVYGMDSEIPYSTNQPADHPISLYAATKKSNELLAYAYSSLYAIPTTGLRFFTVYGPAGRPDMAYFGFTNKLRSGQSIEVYNYGDCSRDFTYIDDIVEGLVRIILSPPPASKMPPSVVYNIGNGAPVNLLEFISILQEELVAAGVLPADFDFEACKRLVPMQPGDVAITFADTTPLQRDFGFKPSTPLREGLRKFAQWYRRFYFMDSGL